MTEESASTKIQLATASMNNKDQNTQKEANISGGNRNKNDELVIEIGKTLKLPDLESTERCHIHKVPRHLRKWKEEAYTPQVVSIGPFHHKNKRLRVMEEHKKRYCRSFVNRSNKIQWVNLVNKIKEMEKRIRGCYEETIDLTSNTFVEMISVDASFILELFIRNTPGIQTRDDPLFVKPRAEAIKFDLLLLENQLPFFVIEELYQHTFLSLYKSDPCLCHWGDLAKLSFYYFKDPCFKFRPYYRPNMKIEHFTDLFRTFLLPTLEERPKRGKREINDLLYTATQLDEAGVKFEVVKSECLFDIKFEKEKGVLKIPELKLEDWTEVVIRNIMALEQTRYIEDTYFTDYLFLMDSLINTREDVDLLCDKKILVNYLGDNRAVNSMINNINKGITWIEVRNDYLDLYDELNRFYANPWHRRKATLKREYFSTPWRGASTVAAIILLVLTFIQTACSIFK